MIMVISSFYKFSVIIYIDDVPIALVIYLTIFIKQWLIRDHLLYVNVARLCILLLLIYSTSVITWCWHQIDTWYPLLLSLNCLYLPLQKVSEMLFIPKSAFFIQETNFNVKKEKKILMDISVFIDKWIAFF